MRQTATLAIFSRVIAAEAGKPPAIGRDEESPYERLATSPGARAARVAADLRRAAVIVASGKSVLRVKPLMAYAGGVDDEHVPAAGRCHFQEPLPGPRINPPQVLAVTLQESAHRRPMPRLAYDRGGDLLRGHPPPVVQNADQ